MSCPEFVCSQCGFTRERIVENVEYDEKRGSKRVFGKYNSLSDTETMGRQDSGTSYVPRMPVTKGWTDCGHDSYQPGIVLDPFCGSGTTGEVALRMGRSFIGIDLYDEYTNMTKERCK